MLFGQYPLFTNSWEDYFIFTLAGVSVYLVVRLQMVKGCVPAGYNPQLAWYRAGIYFCACFIISWATGVFKTLLHTPLATPDQLANPVWLGFTALCILVEIIAYGVIWPKGTVTLGRRLHWPAVLFIGVVWGLSEGQLFLSFWAVAEQFNLSVVWVAIITFIAISLFNGLWHSLYWDIHVAPEHNIVEWNGKKVLFAHIPNLVITLIYLATQGNAMLFVLFQTISLLLSTYFMRFPPPFARLPALSTEN